MTIANYKIRTSSLTVNELGLCIFKIRYFSLMSISEPAGKKIKDGMISGVKSGGEI